MAAVVVVAGPSLPFGLVVRIPTMMSAPRPSAIRALSQDHRPEKFAWRKGCEPGVHSDTPVHGTPGKGRAWAGITRKP